jgi:hypothetical protein
MSFYDVWDLFNSHCHYFQLMLFVPQSNWFYWVIYDFVKILSVGRLCILDTSQTGKSLSRTHDRGASRRPCAFPGASDPRKRAYYGGTPPDNGSIPLASANGRRARENIRTYGRRQENDNCICLKTRFFSHRSHSSKAFCI